MHLLTHLCRDRNVPYWQNVLKAAISHNATILPTILPVVCITALWSALIVFLNHNNIVTLVFEDKLISMLGMALAFLLAFRTNRAFDRYWQGAQLWTTLSIQCRNLSRLIWNGVQTSSREQLTEKHQMMRMVLAVAVATKCALRSGSQPVRNHQENIQSLSKSKLDPPHSSDRPSPSLTAKRLPEKRSSSAPFIDKEVADLLPSRYLGVHTWKESMVDVFGSDPCNPNPFDGTQQVKNALNDDLFSTEEGVPVKGDEFDHTPTPRFRKQTQTYSRFKLGRTDNSMDSRQLPSIATELRSQIGLGEPLLSHSSFSSTSISNQICLEKSQNSVEMQFTPRRSNRVRQKVALSVLTHTDSRSRRAESEPIEIRKWESSPSESASPIKTPNRTQVLLAPKEIPTIVISPRNVKDPRLDDSPQRSIHSAPDIPAKSNIASPILVRTISRQCVSSTSILSIASTGPDPFNPSLSNQSPMQRFPMYDQDGQLVINTPLDIIYRIGFYLRRQRRAHAVDLDDVPSMTQAITTMIDSVTKFEQILNVPMPRSYDIHMKQILLLYFFALPFQLVRSLGWAVVFVTLVVSFAYFGADAIAAEIDGPFGTDKNDLPLDYFCEKLKGDIEYIMEGPLFQDDPN
ncbi:hypothetical protein BASA83_003767 [Batrachochytrium salamandrivorans]|nr:hypothetical protein BASA83_003767 [Batrachochytrium salamandrivorans]